MSLPLFSSQVSFLVIFVYHSVVFLLKYKVFLPKVGSKSVKVSTFRCVGRL